MIFNNSINIILGIDVYSYAINHTVKPYLRPVIRNGLIFLNSFFLRTIKSSKKINVGFFLVSSSNSSNDGEFLLMMVYLQHHLQIQFHLFSLLSNYIMVHLVLRHYK